MATLHFMGGKPGAGKSTLARELGRTSPAIVICEDQWLETLGFRIESLEDYREAARRCGEVMATFVPELLRQGISVVLDVPANTVGARAWVRSLFESAGADHLLHWIDGSDDACLANVRRRNEEKPAGAYFGPVSDEIFHRVLPHIVPPAPEEGFKIARRAVRSRAAGPSVSEA